MTVPLKQFATIGCCGIDCGLCPRFYTTGPSACPGCGGLNFKDKHPSCGVLSCCAVKHELDVCSECDAYPCPRFDPENAGYDSFVTHQKMNENLDAIKDSGMDSFIKKQAHRMKGLQVLLTRFDDGRSKSFYCLSCALLPLESLSDLTRIAHSLDPEMDVKEKAKVMRYAIQEMAKSLGINLKLIHKT